MNLILTFIYYDSILRQNTSLLCARYSTHYMYIVCTEFVHILKTLEILEFQESYFKALKLLEIGFLSWKVLDFLLNKTE